MNATAEVESEAPKRRGRNALWCALAFVAAVAVLGAAWLFFGMATGIVTMCPTASPLWADTWFYGIPPVLLGVAGWASWRAPRIPRALAERAARKRARKRLHRELRAAHEHRKEA